MELKVMGKKIKQRPIIFLDIDGVLNCEIFYLSHPRSEAKSFHEGQLCKDRLKWFNELCEETNAQVVISSSWRLGRTVKNLKDLFKNLGGTFEIIGKTGYTGYERGTEISQWLKDNIMKMYHISYFEFHKYAIIDDDSDMLLNQQMHFFKTDNYSGLTPNICYKIKNFFKKLK